MKNQTIKGSSSEHSSPKIQDIKQNEHDSQRRKTFTVNDRITYILKYLLILLGVMALFNPAYADPPRVLTTSFDDYARQQAQVDKNLSSANTTSHQASSKSSTKPSVSNSSPKNTSKNSAKQKNTTPININLADEASLSNTLIGVGPSKAKAIIDYRQKNGKFKQPEDLLAVKGIGPATLEKNRARIRVN